MADRWTNKVQASMDVIFQYTNELADGDPEPEDGSTKLAEAYRLGSLPKDVNKAVEDARR